MLPFSIQYVPSIWKARLCLEARIQTPAGRIFASIILILGWSSGERQTVQLSVIPGLCGTVFSWVSSQHLCMDFLMCNLVHMFFGADGGMTDYGLRD